MDDPALNLAASLASLPVPAGLFSRESVILILGSSIAGKLFTCYSHTHFPLSASGLRLEISRTTDKEISEVYFAGRAKKILTQKLNRQVSRTSNLSARGRG